MAEMQSTKEAVAFELPFTLYGSTLYVGGSEAQVRMCEQWFRDRWRECFPVMAEDISKGKPVENALKRRIVIEAPDYG
jgi:hypothetical protein